MAEAAIYRHARPDDLLPMGEVYIKAFPDSIRHFYGDARPRAAAFADLFGMVLEAEPAAVMVAEVDRTVVGYCLSPTSLRPIRHVFLRGRGLQLGWRLLTGRYGLGLRAFRVVMADKWAALRAQGAHDPADGARILSLAVDPGAQGGGHGRELLRLALARFDDLGEAEAHLEVRPGNDRARQLYERMGFTAVGHTADSQGEWLVMIRRKGATGP